MFALNQQYRGRAEHPTVPLHSLGYTFIGLDQMLKNVPAIGYLTDKNIESPLTIAQFEQAQYVLAPTMVMLNQSNYPFVILDCSTPEIAMAKIQELKLQPLKMNKGIILALNPSAHL